MYTIPANVDLTTITTNAVPNTATSTVLANPLGVGTRFRIAAYKAWIRRDVTGIIEAFLQDGAGSTWGGFTIGGGAAATAIGGDSGWAEIPYPGFLLPENSGMFLLHTATVASQTLRVVVHYFIDSVT